MLKDFYDVKGIENCVLIYRLVQFQQFVITFM